MKANQFAVDDDAQVGIGTMIVFIATVLVAAVAAGVLINVGGDLQSQSVATGSDASNEISNSLTFVRVYGVDVISPTASTLQTELDNGQVDDGAGGTGGDSDDDFVDEIEIFVSLGAGTEQIDLSSVQIMLDTTVLQDTTTEIESQSGVTTYHYVSQGDADAPVTAGLPTGASFFTVEIQSATPVAGTTLEGNNVAKITLIGTFDGTSGYADRINIPPATDIGLTVVVPNGATSFLELETPRVMDEDYEQLY